MLDYAAIVERRRALQLPGYQTMTQVGLDGPWVTPYHLAARSMTGVAVVTYNYLDAPSAREHRDVLRSAGFLAAMPFNRVLSSALALVGSTRADLYVTHAFHLLPATRSASVPMRDVDISFDQVARHELAGRQVLALGAVAGAACARHGVAALVTPHPSARGKSFAARAATLAEALAEATSRSA